MKKIKTKLTLIALIAGMSASIMASPANSVGTSDAGKTISSKITLPEHFKKAGYSEKVKVIFTVNEQGEVSYAMAETQNKELKNAIEKQFSSLSFTGFKANAANSVVLNFKVY